MLYPGYAAEDDYPLLERLIGDVALPVVHTTEHDVAHTIDDLLAVGQPDELAAGWRELLPHRPDAVVWACTSGSFVSGWDGAAEQARTLAETAGVPASSTSIAFANAARAIGARRVSVVATYPEDVATRFVEFLRDGGGIDVVGFASRGILMAGDVGALGEDAVLELVDSGAHPGADAILLPDTALHSVAWLENLEARAGKPVLTANQVSAWEGLRLAGDRRTCDGLGTLFRSGATRPVTH
ncbi:MAG: maleate cis-trans isomerase [Streptosporangiales bacterium]|nr:maleate cis-trans isomerase [Streptosporangiales bacterium]MBO0892121.1 maleate cis-trans isomerase [Acidothermales bacterium]